MKQETQVVNCEKCRSELPDVSSLKNAHRKSPWSRVLTVKSVKTNFLVKEV